MKRVSIPGIKHWCSFMQIFYFPRNVTGSCRRFVFTKQVTFLISITLETFAAFMLSAKKYLNTSHFLCFVYRQRKRLLRIYLLRVSVEKADRFEPSDKCKERNNSVLHLNETESLSPQEKALA